jgi:hypothetical protein
LTVYCQANLRSMMKPNSNDERPQPVRQGMEQAAENSPQGNHGFRSVQDVLKAAHFGAERHSGQQRKGAASEPPYSVPKQTDCDSLTRWLFTDER